MKRYTGFLIAVPILVGFLTLLGWTFSIGFLMHPLDEAIRMNPMVALCFILAGTAFILDYKVKFSQLISVISATIAVLVAAIGFIKLLAFAGLHAHIDKLLFHDKILAETAKGTINKMAPNTAISFVLLGASLRFGLLGGARMKSICSYMALTVFVIGLFSFIGFTYRVAEYNGVLHYLPMSLQTSVCFICLSAAFLFENDDKEFMQVISSPNTGGSIARFLIPYTILIPMLFGYIRLAIPVSVELGTAGLVTGIIIVFFVMIWFVARALNISDAAHMQSEELYQKMVEEVQDYSILLLDTDGNIQNWNNGAQKIKGYRAAEVIGKNFSIFYTKEDQEAQRPESMLQRALYRGRAEDEGWRVKKDGSLFWAHVTITALHGEHNRIVGFSKMTRDLTERKSTEMHLKADDAKDVA